MRPVTDPELLATLEKGGGSSAPSGVGLRPVTDPELLKKLNTFDTSSLEPSFASKIAPNILAGLAQGGHGLLNAPSNLAKLLASKGILSRGVADKIPRQQDYDFGELLKLPNTGADRLVQGLAQYAPALIAPEANLGKAGSLIEKIPVAGRMAKKVIGNAIPVSAYSATQSDNPEEAAISAAEGSAPFSAISSLISSAHPATRVAARLAATGLGGYGGYKAANEVAPGSGLAEAAGAGAGALLGGFGLNRRKEAERRALSGATPENVQEKLSAAERLGLKYLTPAEASGNPFTGSIQGSLGKTENGAPLLVQRGTERLQTERNAINNLYNKVFDEEKMAPEVNRLYRESFDARVPEEKISALKSNKIYQSAEKNMLKSPAYQQELKGVPSNSIGYLDRIKQSLDDMIEGAPQKEARILKKTKDSLIGIMDEISPEYKSARALAERQITRRNMEESLNEKDVRGTNFYNKNLKNDQNYERLLHSLRNVPEAQKSLEDMRKVFPDLINPPTVRTAAGFSKAGMNQNRNTQKAFMDALKERMSLGKYDQSAVDLITTPGWEKKIAALNDMSPSAQRRAIAKLTELLGRGIGAYAANSEDKK